jgi:hypothetical protein
MNNSAVPIFASIRLQELANFLLVARIAHPADLQSLAVFELKLPAVRIYGGADASTLAKQLRDFRGVLLHVTATDQARQHGDITSGLSSVEERTATMSVTIVAV